MNIYVPDPHPGRCKNIRPGTGWGTEHRRCLDYEGVSHVCSFPLEPKPAAVPSLSGQITTYTQPTPTPWVKPDPLVSREDPKP